MTKLVLISVFWGVAAAAFLRPTPRMRGAFLGMFFGLLGMAGLSHTSVWPCFTWDMWGGVESDHFDCCQIVLVDADGREWRYDVAAVPPTSPAILDRAVGRVLLDEPAVAASVADWLLRRARTLRDSPATIRPQWWTTDLGLLPVGPAARESCTGWSRTPDRRPADFVELVARKRRVHFATRHSATRTEMIAEKRFP